MKARLGKIFWTILFCISGMGLWAQPNTTDSNHQNSGSVRSFDGMAWKMKMMLPGEGIKKGLPGLPPEDIETLVWNEATVPGDVYTDLWMNGVIDDPYFGRNLERTQWVQQYEWWYSYQFKVTKDVKDQVVDLVFDGVDFSCDVWLNNHYLGHHEGAFNKFSFNVNKYLRISATSNLESTNMILVKLDPPPQVNALVAGRKTPWFGDYWRDVTPFGIYRPVKLVRTGKVRFKDVYANNTVNKDGSADVNMEYTVENTSSVPREMTFQTTLEGKNFKMKEMDGEFKQTIAPGVHKIIRNIHLKSPKLWWPWDMGDPNLYTINTSISQGKDLHDVNQTTFGIRKVIYKWNPGFKKGVDVSYPRSTYINGQFHFIRSACWGGPPDIFPGRSGVEKYKKLIQMAKAANMNDIRIFGWHQPEIPEFYKYCDEMGMTVWQDMIPLGTGNIPTDREKLGEIFNTAVAVTKRLRNYPCLIKTEGGEEMMLRTRNAKFGRAFLEELGDSITKYINIQYITDSPLTNSKSLEAGYKSKEAVHALRYFYDMGKWLHEDWYQTLKFPIVPEFAITSVPSVESLKKFIPEKEMWPPGLSWGYHWADLTRLRMQNWDVFGSEMKDSLKEFVDATQIAQGVIFQDGIEYFRRQKPEMSGIALCHYITYWPDMKWGIVDNYTKPKISYDYVKKAYQPLLVNFEFTKRRWHNDEPFVGNIWIINDYYKNYKNCQVKFWMKDDSGNTLVTKSFDVKKINENSAKSFFRINEKILASSKQKFYVNLELTDESGKVISHNDYFFLIGDQKSATEHFNTWWKKRLSIENDNGHGRYGTYWFEYKDFTREDGHIYDSGVQIPRARGFGDDNDQ